MSQLSRELPAHSRPAERYTSVPLPVGLTSVKPEPTAAKPADLIQRAVPARYRDRRPLLKPAVRTEPQGC